MCQGAIDEGVAHVVQSYIKKSQKFFKKNEVDWKVNGAEKKSQGATAQGPNSFLIAILKHALLIISTKY